MYYDDIQKGVTIMCLETLSNKRFELIYIPHSIIIKRRTNFDKEKDKKERNKTKAMNLYISAHNELCWHTEIEIVGKWRSDVWMWLMIYLKILYLLKVGFYDTLFDHYFPKVDVNV